MLIHPDEELCWWEGQQINCAAEVGQSNDIRGMKRKEGVTIYLGRLGSHDRWTGLARIHLSPKEAITLSRQLQDTANAVAGKFRQCDTKDTA